MTKKIKNLVTKIANVQEKFDCGWLTVDPVACPQEIKTLSEKCPEAELVQFGDSSIGIEVGGALWATQMPHELRGAGAQHKLPHATWQWLSWASGLTYTDNFGETVNYGDNDNLRLVSISE